MIKKVVITLHGTADDLEEVQEQIISSVDEIIEDSPEDVSHDVEVFSDEVDEYSDLEDYDE